jgi:hypothetical protein
MHFTYSLEVVRFLFHQTSRIMRHAIILFRSHHPAATRPCLSYQAQGAVRPEWRRGRDDQWACASPVRDHRCCTPLYILSYM